jgi:hypothetical protein
MTRSRERASGEGIVFPVRIGLLCRLCKRPARKFKVPDGLSRASRLFKPLWHLSLTAPGVTTRATVATCVRPQKTGLPERKRDRPG